MSNWIAMYSTLQTHPKMRKIHRATGASSIHETIGRLTAVWWLADDHSDNGTYLGCKDDLDDSAGCVGFADAMISVGWLEVVDENTLVFPRFGDHNGKTAKRRLKEAKRASLNRAAERQERIESAKSTQPCVQRAYHSTVQNRTKQKEEREGGLILPGFQDWHPKARMVNDDSESRVAYESFEAKFVPSYEDPKDRPYQIVAMFLARQPKALKLGWTISRLVEVAEAVQTHEHLTVEQALTEMIELDEAALAKKTRMAIPQHDELIAALRKCENINLNRERVGGSELPSPRDTDYIAYAKSLTPDQKRVILGNTRRAILSEPHGENAAAMHWDARLGSDPLTTLRHDWLADSAGGRWLRARAIMATPKAKETT